MSWVKFDTMFGGGHHGRRTYYEHFSQATNQVMKEYAEYEISPHYNNCHIEWKRIKRPPLKVLRSMIAQQERRKFRATERITFLKNHYQKSECKN